MSEADFYCCLTPYLGGFIQDCVRKWYLSSKSSFLFSVLFGHFWLLVLFKRESIMVYSLPWLLAVRILHWNSLRLAMGRCDLALFPTEEEPPLPVGPQELQTRLFTPPGPLGSALRAALTNRACIAQQHSFLRGFQLHRDYLDSAHFCRWKGNGSCGPAERANWAKQPLNLILNPFSEVGHQVWAESLLDQSMTDHAVGRSMVWCWTTWQGFAGGTQLWRLGHQVLPLYLLHEFVTAGPKLHVTGAERAEKWRCRGGCEAQKAHYTSEG